jgi:hypothetical protein
MKKKRREEKKTKRARERAFTDIWQALSRHMNETREESNGKYNNDFGKRVSF